MRLHRRLLPYFARFYSYLELQLHKLAHEKHTDEAAHVVEFDFEARLVEADARQTTLSRRGTREGSTSFRAGYAAEYTDIGKPLLPLDK